jgi:hypothetical protein
LQSYVEPALADNVDRFCAAKGLGGVEIDYTSNELAHALAGILGARRARDSTSRTGRRLLHSTCWGEQ